MAVAAAKLKHVATNMGPNTAILRPYTSLTGAHSSGPIPNPTRNSDVPSTDTCRPTWKCSATCSVPGAKHDDAQLADMVTRL